MTVPSWTQTVDQLFTSTWMKRQGAAVPQSYLKTPLIYWLRNRDHVVNQAGFTRIEIPLEYGSNETFTWFSKGDTISMQDDELVTMCYEEWRYAGINIMRWFEEEQKNRGRARLLNLLNTKLNAAERAVYENLETVCFADGTGAKEPNGLKNLVAIAPTSGTVHGINRATYTWFQNQTKSASGVAGIYLIDDLRNSFNNVLKYSGVQNKDIFMWTDQTSYELYEAEGYDLRMETNNELFDAGFDNLTYRKRPILWSPSCPTGYWYILNTAYLYLVVDESYWMSMTDWKSIPNQAYDRVAQIVCTYNFICSRPISQLVMYGISAT